MNDDSLWTYRATVLRWIDGDTAEALIHLGFYVTTTQRLRLLGSTGGVDTPELHAPDPAVRALAKRAAARAEELVPLGVPVIIRTVKAKVSQDGFGRFLFEILLADGRSLGDVLVSEGLAVPYVRGA